ncbi:PSP1 domain-containing protein [Salinispira pacifica]|uniref:Signal peptidase-like protein n=1 Tax=Salinispira pacifica TaxID=1307761 RepID=V5WG42_9SPIO|nr:regulatory iron-sulfur-containing complex subunit RicT [Salinispira pacifica]AHC14768.1 Signal peptidase-like protein [Salinispira pacifica]
MSCTPSQEFTDNEKLLSENRYEYVALKVLHTNDVQYCRNSAEVKTGSHYIIPTKYGPDLALAIGSTDSCVNCSLNGSKENGENGDGPRLIEIIEEAGPEDMEAYSQNLERSKEAFQITQELIGHHNLNMKLVRIHFVLRESRIVFFFTSEKRVDFRALVRDLVSHFRARIELRQIGVRDEARMVGGRGVCGRALCCNAIGENLEPVSIKMAKTQKLSLNSQKISGPCGRLLCCLAFEYKTYQKEQEGFPREGQWLELKPGEKVRISEVNILSKKVCAYSKDGVRMEFPGEDIQYTRGENLWRYHAPEIEPEDLL